MKMLLKKWLKRVRRVTTFLFISSLSSLLLFEAAYRYQVIDFYIPELTSLNAPSTRNTQKPIIISGDSFSANKNSYVSILRENYPHKTWLNMAVPGTGITEANIILQKRIKSYNPQAWIYQIYIGNDLFDLHHPTNWETLSIPRNVYWMLSDRLKSIAFLNYRLGQLRSQVYTDLEENAPQLQQTYAKKAYSNRSKMMFNAEPSLIENSTCLNKRYAVIMQDWLEKLSQMTKAIPESTPIYLVIIPHCAQVSPIYTQRMQEIGASFSQEWLAGNSCDAFVQAIEAYPLERQNVKILNCLPYFKEAEEKGQQLYYSNDPHLNQEGQRLLADILGNTI